MHEESSVATPEWGTNDTPLPEIAAVLPLRERVYEAIEAAIVDGALKPGAHLREDDLARQLSVSRNPVREALQRLVHDGLAMSRPGKGIFVHTPSKREVQEVFQVRALLESESARLAATRITEAHLVQFEAILEQGRAAVLLQDTHQLLELNATFHNLIIDISANSVLRQLMIGLRRRIRWYFSQVVVQRSPDSWQQHDDIVTALRNHDGETAARLMRQHVEHTSDAIDQIMATREASLG